jgi:N-acetylneuraminate synthase
MDRSRQAENFMSVIFIAEVCSNHQRDLDRCLAFIDRAAEIGCAAVKFQLFKVRELFSSEALAADKDLLQREAWELPVEFLPHLARRCRERGILFSCTPFYLEAVRELVPYVDFFKIASYELVWQELLAACARTGKPVVLSTGMAILEEVREAVVTLSTTGCHDIALLHCVSSYPTPLKECNLGAIATLRNEFACPVGWSDHSAQPAVLYRAIHAWGAELIEFHLDLDGAGAEYSTGHCWLPEQIAPVIRAAQDGFHADGSGLKSPSASEQAEIGWRADPADGLRPFKRVRRGYEAA